MDALLFGNLKSVTHKEKRDSLGFAYKQKRRTEAVLSARLVSEGTGEVLASSEAAAFVVQKKKVAFGFAKTGNITDEGTAVQSALQVAAQELANNLSAKVPPKK